MAKQKEKLSEYSLFCGMYCRQHLDILKKDMIYTTPGGNYTYKGKKDIQRYIDDCKMELNNHVEKNHVIPDITLEEAYKLANLVEVGDL